MNICSLKKINYIQNYRVKDKFFPLITSLSLLSSQYHFSLLGTITSISFWPFLIPCKHIKKLFFKFPDMELPLPQYGILVPRLEK